MSLNFKICVKPLQFFFTFFKKVNLTKNEKKFFSPERSLEWFRVYVDVMSKIIWPYYLYSCFFDGSTSRISIYLKYGIQTLLQNLVWRRGFNHEIRQMYVTLKNEVKVYLRSNLYLVFGRRGFKLQIRQTYVTPETKVTF